MKFSDKEVVSFFTCFVDDSPSRYARVVPRGVPIWYVATKLGWDLITDYVLYDELESSYHEQEQQTSKKEGVSGKLYLASLEGAERPKPN